MNDSEKLDLGDQPAFPCVPGGSPGMTYRQWLAGQILSYRRGWGYHVCDEDVIKLLDDVEMVLAAQATRAAKRKQSKTTKRKQPRNPNTLLSSIDDDDDCSSGPNDNDQCVDTGYPSGSAGRWDSGTGSYISESSKWNGK